MPKLACTSGDVIATRDGGYGAGPMIERFAASLPPLPTPGTRPAMQRPLPALACGLLAFVLAGFFAHGYAAANPPETGDAIRRGDARPVWARAMWVQILGAFALLRLMLAVPR